MKRNHPKKKILRKYMCMPEKRKERKGREEKEAWEKKMHPSHPSIFLSRERREGRRKETISLPPIQKEGEEEGRKANMKRRGGGRGQGHCTFTCTLHTWKSPCTTAHCIFPHLVRHAPALPLPALHSWEVILIISVISTTYLKHLISVSIYL